MEPYELTINQALDAMSKKELSAVELTGSCLDRIEAVDPTIRAFVSLSRDSALEAAAEADRTRDAMGAVSARWIAAPRRARLCAPSHGVRAAHERDHRR